MNPRSGRIPFIIGILLGALAIGLVLTALAGWAPAWPFGGGPRATPALILEGVQEAAKLTSAEVVIQVVHPVTEESWERDRKALIVMEAKALVGIDLAELTEESLRRDGDTWVITLPEPRVLDVVLFPESAQYYAVQTGLLGHQVSPQRLLQEEGEMKLKAQAFAGRPELLARARANAAKAVRELVSRTGVQVRVE